jgi:SAM-dependent methyltransferase
MGVDLPLFERLCELSQRFHPTGRTLMLGRHRFGVPGRFRRNFDRALRRSAIEGVAADFVQEDGYCENLMAKLGFGEMESLDFSDYEGAHVVHDLNTPIPVSLENQFDLIFDGGTLEHVFNVPVALTSIFRMLKVGGRFISANGMNGWPMHGLYQFNPELAWTFWARACGCHVHNCLGLPKDPTADSKIWVFPDPAARGKRLRLRGKGFPAGRIYLYYEIERLPTSSLLGSVLQSDYETKWQNHQNAGAIRFDTVEEASDAL